MCVRAQCQRRKWKESPQQVKATKNKKLVMPKEASPEVLGQCVREA